MLGAMSEGSRGFEVEVLLREAGWIQSLARGLSDPRLDARDLEQETWLAALRARPHASEGLRPWLATVMRNAARALARGEVHRRDREDVGARPEALPSAETLVERADLQRALVAQVLALEEPYRSTVLLCFYEGLSPAEIALRQGVPAGSVRSRLSRALAQLRRRLDEQSGGDRARWLAALAPLASPGAAPMVLGTLLMKKIAVVVLCVVLAGLGWFQWSQRRAGPEAATPTAQVGRPSGISVPAEPAPEGAASVPLESEVTAVRQALPSSAPAAPAPGRRRVRLLDERTGEPVPEFRLALLGEGSGTTDLVSDPRGEFEFELPSGAEARFDLVENLGGNDLIQTRRDQVIPVRVALPLPNQAEAGGGLAKDLELRIPVGPTYRLRLEPPPGHGFEELSASLRASDPRRAFDVARAVVRAGAEPWLRFRPGANFMAGGPPWKLEVVTADGLWSAVAQLEQLGGVARDPVVLTFEPRARLFGRLRSEDGAIVGGQWVRLEREGASFDNPANRPLMVHADSQGGFEFRALAPGPWKLRVEVEEFEAWRQELTLAAQEARELDPTLRRLAPAQLARLEGSIESSTGRYSDAVYVSIFPMDGRGGRGVDVTWTEVDGRRTGRFVVEDLKVGRYTVVGRVPGLLRVEPRRIEVEAGGPPVRFSVLDDVETVAWHVRARAGDRELEKFRVTLEADGLETTSTASQGLAVIELIPRGQRCEFTLRADGFAPSFGEVEPDGATSPEDPARIELRPGWGTEVTVVDESGLPLAGARIHFDGQFAAESDGRGRARVTLDREPATVRVEYQDWVLAPGTTIAPDTGRFRTWEPWLKVILNKP